MKVLVISHESWSHTNNGGNVLSNIFGNLDFEIAQIYCSAGLPQNNICQKYYQITDKMILDYLLKGKTIGKIFTSNKTDNNADLSFESKSKKRRWEIIFMLREIIWSLAKIDNHQFVDFINDFSPDVIFAPCYGNIRMLRLTRIVSKYTKAPIISYVSDDLYSYQVINLNPLFWIRRWNLRRNVRKTCKLYKLMYTMTKEQLEEYQNELNVPMKILRKGCTYSGINKFFKPYSLIFAGNIYLQRADVLCELVKVIEKYNRDNINFVLHIYTGGELNDIQKEFLNNGKTTFVHGLISSEELKNKYKESHVALHVESFNLKNALITRLSFSTKITDCLESGCALMAICPSINAGFNYLKEEDAAICIDDIAKMDEIFKMILEDENYLLNYANKAKDCIFKNHDQVKNDKMILDDFKNIYKNK